MKRQSGMSLTMLLVICAVLIAAALLGFKLFPSYAEFMTIRKALQEIARNPESRGSAKEIQNAFARRSAIDNIKSVTPQDIEVAKDGDKLVATATWSVKVPLFYNISACLDFEAKSTDP